MYMSMYVYMYMYMHMYMHMDMYMYVYICVYTYTCIQDYTSSKKCAGEIEVWAKTNMASSDRFNQGHLLRPEGQSYS